MKDMNSLTSIFDFLVLIHNNAGMNMEFFECLNNGNGISSLRPLICIIVSWYSVWIISHSLLCPSLSHFVSIGASYLWVSHSGISLISLRHYLTKIERSIPLVSSRVSTIPCFFVMIELCMVHTIPFISLFHFSPHPAAFFLQTIELLII